MGHADRSSTVGEHSKLVVTSNGAARSYVTVPFNNELYVQPGAPEQIVDPVGWTLIIGLKYGTVSSCEEQTQMPPRSRYGPTWMGRVELPSYRTPSSPLTTINEERRYFEAGPSI